MSSKSEIFAKLFSFVILISLIAFVLDLAEPAYCTSAVSLHSIQRMGFWTLVFASEFVVGFLFAIFLKGGDSGVRT